MVSQQSLQADEMSCNTQGSPKCYLGPSNDAALGNLVGRENQGDQAFIADHQPQPHDGHHFIHESNKADSVLKAFTVGLRAHE